MSTSFGFFWGSKGLNTCTPSVNIGHELFLAGLSSVQVLREMNKVRAVDRDLANLMNTLLGSSPPLRVGHIL